MKKGYIVLGISLVCIFILGIVILVGGFLYVVYSVTYRAPTESRDITVEMKTLEPPLIEKVPEGSYRVEKIENILKDMEKPPTLMTIDVFKISPNSGNRKDKLDKDLNTYYLNGRAWKLDDSKSPSNMRRVLVNIAKNDPDQIIIINIGPNAYQYKLIKLLNACKKAGLKNLIITPDESIRFQPE